MAVGLSVPYLSDSIFSRQDFGGLEAPPRAGASTQAEKAFRECRARGPPILRPLGQRASKNRALV